MKMIDSVYAKVLLLVRIYIPNMKRIRSIGFPKHSARSVPSLTQLSLLSAETLDEVFYSEYAPTRGIELATPRH